MLFVIVLITVSCLGIMRVNASEFSSMKCVYTWIDGQSEAGGSGTKTVNFNLQYTEQGTLKVPKNIEWTRKYLDPTNRYAKEQNDYITETKKYKIVNANFKVSHFVKGKHLQPICPGSNDIDFYMDEDSKKIYIATSESALKSYLDSKNIDYGTLRKAKLSSQNINNGSKIIIDGQTYDTEKTLSCDYEHSDYKLNLHLEIGQETGNLLVATFKDATKNFRVVRIDGDFSGTRCPRKVSASGNNDYIETKLDDQNDNANKVNLYRDPSKGKTELKLSDASREQETSQGSAYPIQISEISGCGIWGSLLALLRDDVFGLIKYTLIGFLIVFGMMDFAKAALSGEDNSIKKAASKFFKRVVVVIIIFLLPLLIETIIELILSGEGISIETCISDF